jgi:Tol biopolymer transport system component
LSIWAISIETGERRRLTSFLTKSGGSELPLGDHFPSVSPDGRALAFARQASSYTFELYALRLAPDLRPEGNPKLVTNQRYSTVSGIAWTANGLEIVYGAGGVGVNSLWRVSVSGGHAPTRLPYATPAAMFPAIAARTSRLVYTWGIHNVNLWHLDTRTGERRMLIGSTYDSRIPQYSPDGRKIAFQSNRSGNLEVWTCEADGSNCQQLTSFGGPQCGSPHWSPDSRWLALDSRSEGQPEIYVIAADGGTPRRMTNHPANDILPIWSRDGRWVYFTSDRSGRYELWKVPRDGGEAVQTTRSGGYVSFASPDGRYFYYSKFQQQGVFRMPAEGGEEVQVLSASSRVGVTAKGVYFFAPGGKTIQLLDTATGKVSTLATLEKPGAALTVSPDDAYIVWFQTDRDTQDLVLVENFR